MAFLRFIPIFSVSLLFTACGNGGTGRVALELTDAPPDLTTLDKVEVTIGAVEVHVAGGDLDDGRKSAHADRDVGGDHKGEGGGTWITVTERAGSFDLLSLQNNVTARLGELKLPDGKITQIRLFIDGAGRNDATLKTGEQCALDLSEVSEQGIKINHPFKALEAPSGSLLHVVVDFDVKESLDQQAACSFKLKPVIKIKSTELEADDTDDDDKADEVEDDTDSNNSGSGSK